MEVLWDYMANKPSERVVFWLFLCYYEEKDSKMDIDFDSLVELAKVVAPISATMITYFHTQKTAKKHAAKQSILQMIMEDQLNWELFRKFPTNYGNIQDEYEVYHKCGGNGEVTKKFKEYNDWYETNEKQMREMASMNCKPEVTITCSTGK